MVKEINHLLRTGIFGLVGGGGGGAVILLPEKITHCPTTHSNHSKNKNVDNSLV